MFFSFSSSQVQPSLSVLASSTGKSGECCRVVSPAEATDGSRSGRGH